MTERTTALASQPLSALFGAVIAAVMSLPAPGMAAPVLPEIRMTNANMVPACVTPERLMAFLERRNAHLEPRFRNIATWYRRHGDAWRVRWDYAFYQMAIETNYLTFRRGDGRRGDVDPKQNNFAGIGATGGGVPGDSFPDIATGVLAQIQHLVAYSGERLAEPVAPRTALKQDVIVRASLDLARPVRFSDLSRRWAVDPHYARSIEWIAGQYRNIYCAKEQAGVTESDPANSRLAAGPDRAKGRAGPVRTVWQRPAKQSGPAASAQKKPNRNFVADAVPPSRLGAGATACSISEASYGGTRTVLIRLATAGEIRFTALSVLEGFEDSMTRNYIDLRAPGGDPIGTFASKDEAMARAEELCPVSHPNAASERQRARQ